MQPVPEMPQVDETRRVDYSAVKTGQAFLAGGMLLAFVLNAPWLVVFVAVAMMLSALSPALSLPTAIYQWLLRPSGIVRPDVRRDNPEPHRFSQGLGGSTALMAAGLLFSGALAAGWVMALSLVGLASLNLFAEYCVGAKLYYQLNRWGVRGFERAPLKPGPGKRAG